MVKGKVAFFESCKYFYDKYSGDKIMIVLPTFKNNLKGNVGVDFDSFREFIRNNNIKAVVGQYGKSFFKGLLNIEHACMEACEFEGIPYILVLHSILEKQLNTYKNPSATVNEFDAEIQGYNSKAIGNWRLDDIEFSHYKNLKRTNKCLVLSQNMYTVYGKKKHHQIYDKLFSQLGDWFWLKLHPADKFDYSKLEKKYNFEIFPHNPTNLYYTLKMSKYAIAIGSNALVEALLMGAIPINIVDHKLGKFIYIFLDSKAIVSTRLENLPYYLNKGLKFNQELADQDIKRYFYKVDGKCWQRLNRMITSYLKGYKNEHIN